MFRGIKGISQGLGKFVREGWAMIWGNDLLQHPRHSEGGRGQQGGTGSSWESVREGWGLESSFLEWREEF